MSETEREVVVKSEKDNALSDILGITPEEVATAAAAAVSSSSVSASPSSSSSTTSVAPYVPTRDLLSLVREYLRFQGFHDTCDCLDAELKALTAEFQHYAGGSTNGSISSSSASRSGRRAGNSSSPAALAGLARNAARSIESRLVQQRVQRQLLRAFDDGDWVRFDAVWERSIAAMSALNTSFAIHEHRRSEQLRLRFKLAVYFATFLLRDENRGSSSSSGGGQLQYNREREVAMDRFRVFIEQEKLPTDVLDAHDESSAGTRDDKKEDLTIFYALPYVPNPRAHPGIAYVFEDTWLVRLKLELQDFLRLHMAAVSTPQLAMIHNLWQNAEGLVERHTRKLAQMCEDILEITYSVFTVALAAMGQEASAVPPNKKIQAQLFSLMRRLVVLEKAQKQNPVRRIEKMPRMINYNALRWQLRNADSDTVQKLLSALLVRMSQTHPNSTTLCRELISSAVLGDILELNLGPLQSNADFDKSGGTLITHLLAADSKSVAAASLQLVHWMACSYEGKHYLCTDSGFLRQLCTLVTNGSLASSRTARTLSVLQRLSLAPNCCAICVDQPDFLPRCFDFICQLSEDPTANSISTSIIASTLAILTNVLCFHGDEESVRHMFSMSDDLNNISLKRFCPAVVELVAKEGPQKRWLRSASRRILYLLAASPTGRQVLVEETQALIVLKMNSPEIDSGEQREIEMVVRRLETKTASKEFPIAAGDADFEEDMDEMTDFEDEDGEVKSEECVSGSDNSVPMDAAKSEELLAPYFLADFSQSPSVSGGNSATQESINAKIIQHLAEEESREHKSANNLRAAVHEPYLQQRLFGVGQTVDVSVPASSIDGKGIPETTEVQWKRGRVTFLHPVAPTNRLGQPYYDIVLDTGDKLTHVEASCVVPCFAADEIVEAQFNGLDTWFTAVVCGIESQQAVLPSSEPQYKLRYAAGNEEVLPISLLRLASEKWNNQGHTCVGLPAQMHCLRTRGGQLAPAPIQKANSVNNDTVLVPGQITRMDSDRNLFTVTLEDGTTHSRVRASQLQPIFLRGVPIEARFRGLGRWFSGLISSVHFSADGKEVESCDVDFATGHLEARVPVGHLRMFGALGQIGVGDHFRTPDSASTASDRLLTDIPVRNRAPNDSSLSLREAHLQYFGQDVVPPSLQSRGSPGPHPLSVGSVQLCDVDGALLGEEGETWTRVWIVACRSTKDDVTKQEIFEYDVVWIHDPVPSTDPTLPGEGQPCEGDTTVNVPEQFVRLDLTQGMDIQIWMPRDTSTDGYHDSYSLADADHDGNWRIGVVTSVLPTKATCDVWINADHVEYDVPRSRLRQGYSLSKNRLFEDNPDTINGQGSVAAAIFCVGKRVTVPNPNALLVEQQRKFGMENKQAASSSHGNASRRQSNTYADARTGLVVGARRELVGTLDRGKPLHEDQEQLVVDVVLGEGSLLVGLPVHSLLPASMPVIVSEPHDASADGNSTLGSNSNHTGNDSDMQNQAFSKQSPQGTGEPSSLHDGKGDDQNALVNKVFAARDQERRKYIVAQLQTQALRSKLEKALDWIEQHENGVDLQKNDKEDLRITALHRENASLRNQLLAQKLQVNRLKTQLNHAPDKAGTSSVDTTTDPHNASIKSTDPIDANNTTTDASSTAKHMDELDDENKEAHNNGSGFSVGDPVYIQHGDTWVEGFVVQRIDNSKPTMSGSETNSNGNAAAESESAQNALEEGTALASKSQDSKGACYVICLLDKTLVPDVKASCLQLRTNLFTQDAVEECSVIATELRDIDMDYAHALLPDGKSIQRAGFPAQFWGAPDALQGDHTSDEALEAFYSSSQVALAELTSHLALQAHEEKSEVADISADTQESKASTVNVKTAFLAAAAGDNEILHKMLTEANVDPFHECNDDGYSLLMVAAGHNHLKTVRFLLDWHSPSIRKTATENESHAKDETLATADAEHSRQQETYAKEAALHLAKFTTSKNATSVLHVAAAFGGADILKAILDTKVDLTIDAYTNIVATAVQENRTENTAILAQRCMELGCGEYAMGAASLACGLRRACYDGRLQLAQRLCSIAGENVASYVNAPDAKNRSPLLTAVSFGHDGIVNFLLEHNADPNIRSSEGVTPLRAAALLGSKATVTALLKAKADVDLQLPDLEISNTEAMLASFHGHFQILALLRSEANASFELRNKSGKTVPEILAMVHNLSVDEMLTKAQDLDNEPSHLLGETVEDHDFLEALKQSLLAFQTDEKQGMSASELHEALKQLSGKFPVCAPFKAFLLGNFFREVPESVSGDGEGDMSYEVVESVFRRYRHICSLNEIFALRESAS